MKARSANVILVLCLALMSLSFDIPQGWFKAGSAPNSYDMGIDKASGQDGTDAATIKSIEKKIDGFGTLMQESKPDPYLGKRVRMSAYVKSENVADWAGIWFRVDKSGSEMALAFDNMQNRPIKGTTGWTKYEIVLYVPKNASMLAFGALLSGTGQIWFDNIKFEIVDNSVMTTGYNMSENSTIQDEPTNLDFEK
jgi:hypothetical protein